MSKEMAATVYIVEIASKDKNIKFYNSNLQATAGDSWAHKRTIEQTTDPTVSLFYCLVC